ncbi:ankyrin repeat domain-containing protein 26-like [Lemur catta]|uniref:ankyrin repeat domain-containing protein 26-like n=1 Tax=Lemur catta TaxID=9447 RepID=UPI001E26B2F1|nr:ankyrin repeat domain-containing protein 26-like [Lemur catta]
MHKSEERMVSENLHDGAAAATNNEDEATQARKSGNTENQHLPSKEECDGPAKKRSKQKNKVKEEEMYDMHDLDDFTEPVSASEDAGFPFANYDKCLLQIEQLGKDCEGQVMVIPHLEYRKDPRTVFTATLPAKILVS